MTVKTYPRLSRPPGQSFFLLGVRGVGKSAWAQAQFLDAPRVDLLDEAGYQDYLADPHRLSELQHRLLEWAIFTPADVTAFAEI